ncbi:glyoxylate reductase/hydroxypyruvate reductase-like [Trichoplusia ni]|uniref:Glyoxylate reductase/hydroxypyruvate reductase n=1 Tax=Trichoplusia ni TaxID=7111 RepID=A0A7E5VVW6_TRINI|nr:glyoxylate reductase/hydroxypyruvate reductase-like [Trichoplusia ni]
MIYKRVSPFVPSLLRSVARQSEFVTNPVKIMKCDSKFEVFVTRADMPESGIEMIRRECNVKLWNRSSPVPRDEFLKLVPGVNAIYCCLTDKIDKELLDAAGPELKAVATMSVGYDHIDIQECNKRGIRVGYTPDVLTDATAELTVALLLATARRLPEAQAAARDGGWESWSPMWMTGPGLADSTVGIVGFGRIGQAVARRVKGFNTKDIIYCSRTARHEAKEVGARKVEFDDLLAESDFVICCAVLVPETRHMFNRVAFDKMKRTAIFINTSRGGTVDQEALTEALQHKIIRGAGLDVTTPEPLPLDHPLLSLNNCIVLPHIGSATIDARKTMAELTAVNILEALKGFEMPSELKIT